MKKSNNMITGAATLVALIAVTGIAISAFAQDATSDSSTPERQYRKPFWEDLSESAQAEIKELQETRQAERQVGQEKMEAAFKEGYEAWVAAIKEVQGEDAPILEQVTAENFEQYRQAHDYMEQARENMDNANAIFKELGIRRGFGMKGGHDRHGFMKPMGGFGGTQIQ